MATQQSIKAAMNKPVSKVYLRHPITGVKMACWRGHAALLLIKKCGYVEITKAEYEAGES